MYRIFLPFTRKLRPRTGIFNETIVVLKDYVCTNNKCKKNHLMIESKILYATFLSSWSKIPEDVKIPSASNLESCGLIDI